MCRASEQDDGRRIKGSQETGPMTDDRQTRKGANISRVNMRLRPKTMRRVGCEISRERNERGWLDLEPGSEILKRTPRSCFVGVAFIAKSPRGRVQTHIVRLDTEQKVLLWQNKSNYRRVSILVTLDKVYEKCLASQLSDYFTSILSSFLSAHRRGYSCDAVFLRLIDYWRNSLDNKCVVGGISMDLSKAFDMIPNDFLLAKLATYGVSPVSLPLPHSYLRDWSQRVRIEDAF